MARQRSYPETKPTVPAYTDRFAEPLTARLPAGPSLAVFDIGGTWFRSGLVTDDDRLVGTSRCPAINYLSVEGAPVPQLQGGLARYLVESLRRLEREFETHVPIAAVSMGAAVDAHTGMVLGSGPLWGPGSTPFDLLTALRELDPRHEWLVQNDVSAALVRCVADQPTDADLAKVTVVTVSTGIAARTYDVAAGAIPTDRKAGVQGEIGHLPVEFRFQDRGFHQMCDCGGASHLNAFASGRGIDRTLGLVCFAFPTTYGRSILSALTGGQPGAARVSHLVDAVHMDDPAAWSLLDAFTAPLARILLTHLAFDPQVERVILVGGVVHAFGPPYLQSLLSHLESAGLYQISERNPGVFRDRFVIGPDDDHSGLIGAAIAARQALAGSPNHGSPRRRGWSVRAALPIEYRVEVVDELFEPGNPAIVNSRRRPSGLQRRLVVVDRSVQERYGDRLRRYFDSCCDEFALMPLDATETRKDAGAVARLLRTFDGFNLLRRSEPVVAVGGGVLLDVVGFAASIYRRGTPYIRVPTTLVAMIDAGVGVKTGINFRGSKNRIGTYFPPIASLIDRSFLRTLPSRHLRSGMAEIVKMAIACDSTLFDLVESHGATLVAERFQSDLGEEVIRRAVTEMLDELEPNLWERTLERAVDLGHTFSPVLEASPQGGLLHGEAVALDLALSSVIARNRGLLRADELDRILGMIRTLGLPVHDSLITMPLLLRGLKNATLHRDGAQRLPVPTSIGMVTWLNDVTASEIECAARSLAAVR